MLPCHYEQDLIKLSVAVLIYHSEENGDKSLLPQFKLDKLTSEFSFVMTTGNIGFTIASGVVAVCALLFGGINRKVKEGGNGDA